MNPFEKNWRNETSRDLAMKYKKYEIASFLEEYEAMFESKYTKYYGRYCQDFILYLEGIRILEEGEEGLLLAMKGGSKEEVIAILEEKPFDLYHPLVQKVCLTLPNNEEIITLLDGPWTAIVSEVSGFEGKTLVHAACEEGDERVVRLLLDTYNVQIEEADNIGRTICYLAAQYGHSDLFKMLCNEYDANIWISTRDGWTLWHVACEYGQEEIVRMLHDEYASLDINALTRNGSTPFFLACKYDHGNIVTLLHEYEADIHQTDHMGKTPAWIAASEGHEGIIRLLHEYEADLYQANNFNKKPSQIASQRGHQNVVEVLRELQGRW